jgi:regulatory protein
MAARRRDRDVPPPPGPDEDEAPSDPESVARAIVLRALTQRARSRSELATLLASRGVPDDAARAVLDRFAEVGLVDDVALARGFAEAAHRERGLSGRAVATKLRQRGIDEPVVQETVARIDPASERAAAQALAERKARTLRGLDPVVQIRRLVSLLARRGYPPGLSYAVAREVVGTLGHAESAGFDAPVDAFD